MAATPLADPDAERALVEPFAKEIVHFVREADPQVTFAIQPPIDPGIWLLYLYVRPGLVDDVDFREVVAGRANDILVEHDIAIANLWRAREGAANPLVTGQT